MEAIYVRQVEFLHLCDIVKTFKVICGKGIPSSGAAVFHCTGDVFHFDDILRNLFEVAFEYAFINCRKCITLEENAYFRFVEAVCKAQFTFYIVANFLQLTATVTTLPFMHKLIAIRFV